MQKGRNCVCSARCFARIMSAGARTSTPHASEMPAAMQK